MPHKNTRDIPATNRECVAGRSGLPRYVHRRKRDGVLLFRRREGTKIREVRLATQFDAGEPVPQSLFEEVEGLLRPHPSRTTRYPTPAKVAETSDFTNRQGESVFAAMQRSARARAAKYRFKYSLPAGWAEEVYERQGRRCAVTGIEFRKTLTKRSPFMPSLDRIDPKRGYTPSNCRLVAYIVNCALNGFGEEDFIKMCKAVAARAEWRLPE